MLGLHEHVVCFAVQSKSKVQEELLADVIQSHQHLSVEYEQMQNVSLQLAPIFTACAVMHVTDCFEECKLCCTHDMRSTLVLLLLCWFSVTIISCQSRFCLHSHLLEQAWNVNL